MSSNRLPALVSPSLCAALAPTGVLRAAINLGNPILAHRADDGAGAGGAGGVSVDLAGALARVLGVPLALVVFDTAAQSVEAVVTEQADFGFFAIDPLRGQQIAFTAPYVLIEGYYLVRDDAPIVANGQVDVAGVQVVVGKGSAYDLYLTRTLQQAQLLRAASSQTVVDTFLASGAQVAAGVRQQLESDAARVGGVRLLDQRFMVIEQALGLPKSRGAEAAAFLARFVEDAKASALVAAALERHHIKGASVAPAA
ncbi:transporter substrate-binding domain-containing protein [Massilia sp. DWR3-1-1]|uniref:transporter substrate-binding domain-containing protein n=1 Tax=Massilia sp. DWR3-1-1 TaxID=2804559 RepID=UPI003CF8FDF3